MDSKPHKTFVILDGHALIYRGYFALPPLRTQQGEIVNAVYGFATILLNMLQKVRPDYLAVAFDMKEKTFRHEAYEGYKATRAVMPDDLISQLPRIREVVDAFKIPVLQHAGFEADDLIATLSEHLREHPEVQLRIVTGDMDLTQLIRDGVKLMTPLTGFNEVKVYDADTVREKYGVGPEQMVDYKALVGDTSDNIMGVAGIGPKGASTLLQKYGTLDGIYAHLDEVVGATHDKLVAGKESAYQSQGLVTLIRNVPMTLDLAACQAREVDGAHIRKLFEVLEFKRLIPKFDGLQEGWAQEEQPALF
jgi:DNA polymerase-1